MQTATKEAKTLIRRIHDTEQSVERVAADIGVSLTTVYSWSKGRSVPDDMQAAHLCRVLKMKRSDFTRMIEAAKAEAAK